MRLGIILCVFLLMPGISGCTVSEKKANTDSEQENIVIFDKEWKWQASLYNNDTKITVPNPENYTILLKEKGDLKARLDCNRGGGNYEIDQNKMKMEILFSTRAMCPEDSLDQKFIKDLSHVQSFFMRDGQLYMELEHHAGTMRFSL